MKLLFDFFPIVLFFIFFKLAGVYAATIVSIAASILQVLFVWIKNKRVDTFQKLTLAVVVLLGGATLLFHNALFIKWKPTVIYWVTALVLGGSLWIRKQNLLQKAMGKNMELPTEVWTRLNYSWVIFLFFMGTINLYVAYGFNTEVWVNFKLFGGLGLTVLFVIIQSVYLSRCAHMTLGDTRR